MPSLREQLEPHIRAFGVGRLADATGIRGPNISEFLHGKRSMREENLTKMATALGFEIVIRRTKSASAGARPAARPGARPRRRA